VEGIIFFPLWSSPIRKLPLSNYGVTTWIHAYWSPVFCFLEKEKERENEKEGRRERIPCGVRRTIWSWKKAFEDEDEDD
jgi:hypothetical protein